MNLREQYERFPYPPIPALALPRRGQGEGLRFELGAQLVRNGYAETLRDHRGIRILVAGAGTFETLVVAQTHPRAAELVAVDLSGSSLAKTRARLRLHRLARPFTRLPCVRLVAADLRDWSDPRGFDYILASNVLHHVEDPAALLSRLAGMLRPGGLLRLVTYPKASRLWMREAGHWLALNGVTPGTPSLKRRAHEAIGLLPPEHPARLAFETQGETAREAGIVDAFLNACENPLSPLEWREATRRAGLSLVAETQAESSRSAFVVSLLPATAALDAWTRLQILDDFLELCANPVLWLRKIPSLSGGAPAAEGTSELAPAHVPDRWAPRNLDEFWLPSRPLFELAWNLRRAEALLSRAGISLKTALDTFRTEVGPRVSAPPEERPLPGLAATDYELSSLLALEEPWRDHDWQELERELGSGLRLEHEGVAAPSGPLHLQAAWHQCRFGASKPEIPLRLLRDSLRES
ncbi:MAG: class I SAM-dependent methyltransferase [Oligoflexia bacterium]|nr:class I SAM-dependent methyltransferase [Oligoflexia bacterium]